jgi:hypothetical protein
MSKDHSWGCISGSPQHRDVDDTQPVQGVDPLLQHIEGTNSDTLSYSEQ